MIWILPKDYNFYRIKWSHIKCSKNIFPFWKASSVRILWLYKFCQFSPIWFFKFVLQCFFPGWMDFDCHRDIVEKNTDLQRKIPSRIYRNGIKTMTRELSMMEDLLVQWGQVDL
jgi:hypothetical protein